MLKFIRTGRSAPVMALVLLLSSLLGVGCTELVWIPEAQDGASDVQADAVSSDVVDAADVTTPTDARDGGPADVVDAPAPIDVVDANPITDVVDAADVTTPTDARDGGPADVVDASADAAVCPVDQTFCAGRCLTTATDLANCGRCGGVCRSGESCVAGMCRASLEVRASYAQRLRIEEDTSLDFFQVIDAPSANRLDTSRYVGSWWRGPGQDYVNSRLPIVFALSAFPRGAVIRSSRLEFVVAGVSSNNPPQTIHAVTFTPRGSVTTVYDYDRVRWGTRSLGSRVIGECATPGTRCRMDLVPGEVPLPAGAPYGLGFMSQWDFTRTAPPIRMPVASYPGLYLENTGDPPVWLYLTYDYAP